MSIQKGDSIPAAKLFELDEPGTPCAVSAAERFAGKRVVLFAVPGAYTRTCSEKHLPSFVQHAEAIKARSIDEIVCVAVNDAMVLAAWGRDYGTAGKSSMLSDGLGDFTRAIGLRTEAAAEPGMEERILTEHQDGVERVGAFGVPTLSINGQRGFFGPVITSVPTGEDAGELWDHIAWLSARGDFFEYKRSRK